MDKAIFLCIIFQCLTTAFSDELIGVSAIVTTGDTIPAKFYPTDPYKNSPIWEKPLGQLSNLGLQETYAVGQWLRRRYDDKNPFLTLQYNASQIYAYSENRDPSLMSGECLMAGLYPPVGDEIWNRRIHWRPTPVHNTPLDLDHIIGRGMSCPKYDRELNKVIHGRFLRTINREDKNLLDYLSENTGETFHNIHGIPQLFDILSVEQSHKLPLPNWTHAVYPKVLGETVLEMSVMRTKNPEITKLSIGPLLYKVKQQFNAIITHDPQIGNLYGDIRKFKLYIGNSTIIYDTLHALKVPSVGIVPSAATLIFELRQTTTGNLYVQLLYRQSTERNAQIYKLKIGGCKSVKCPYVAFDTVLDQYAVSFPAWSQLCQM